MGIFKKLFSKKQKSEEILEKKAECWYNNEHEKGEVFRGDLPYGTGGSENAFMEMSNSH